MNKVDEKICPICGEYNNCQSGEDTCWCYNIVVPKELIEKVPEEKRGKACICKDCIDKYNNNKK